jgi:hypothetical protein
MDGWVTGLLELLAGVIILLLTLILARLNSLENKLDGKQSKEDCMRQVAVCQKLIDIDGVWREINSHSHTGLPEGSKVVR